MCTQLFTPKYSTGCMMCMQLVTPIYVDAQWRPQLDLSIRLSVTVHVYKTFLLCYTQLAMASIMFHMNDIEPAVQSHLCRHRYGRSVTTLLVSNAMPVSKQQHE